MKQVDLSYVHFGVSVGFPEAVKDGTGLDVYAKHQIYTGAVNNVPLGHFEVLLPFPHSSSDRLKLDAALDWHPIDEKARGSGFVFRQEGQVWFPDSMPAEVRDDAECNDLPDYNAPLFQRVAQLSNSGSLISFAAFYSSGNDHIPAAWYGKGGVVVALKHPQKKALLGLIGSLDEALQK